MSSSEQHSPVDPPEAPPAPHLPVPNGASSHAVAGQPGEARDGTPGDATATGTEVQTPPSPLPASQGPAAEAAAGDAASLRGRGELTVVLTLIPARDGDTALRACYSVGGAETPYPVMSTLVAADAAWAAAQIPGRIADAEARWLAQPTLARATTGATTARPAAAANAGTTTTRSKAGGKEKRRPQGASPDGTNRLAAALRADTPTAVAATTPGPTEASPGTPIAPRVAAPAPVAPAEIPTAPERPAPKATLGSQLSLFG